MFALITMLALARADDAGRVPRARESRWSPGRRSADAEDAPHIRKTQVRYAGERRRATAASDDAASAFAPLRIATYSGAGALDGLSAAQRTFLEDTLLPRTVADWAELLGVRPVDGSLALDRPCALSYADEDGCYGTLCSSVNADEYCGSDADDSYNTLIPDDYFGATTYCSTCYGSACDGAGSVCADTAAGAGVADADFVLFVTAHATASCDGGTLA